MKNLQLNEKTKNKIIREVKHQQELASKQTFGFIKKHFKIPLNKSEETSLQTAAIEKNKELSALALKYTFLNDPVFRFTYEPPFDLGSGPTRKKAKKIDGTENYLLQLISAGNSRTGEISVAAIAGQNFYDLYPDLTPTDEINFLFGIGTCGMLSEKFSLPGPTDRPLILVSSAEFELPLHGVDAGIIYDLKPGEEIAPLYGLTGATGYLHLRTAVGGPESESNALFNEENFLMKFATKSAENGIYENNINIINYNEVATGTKEFSFFILAEITAYVSKKFADIGSLSPQHCEYSMIDLRAIDLLNDDMLRNANGTIRRPFGGVKVKRMTFSFYEPEFSVDHSHDTD
jgi:hypothetical protein